MAPACSLLLSPRSAFPKCVPRDLCSIGFCKGSSHVHQHTDGYTHSVKANQAGKPSPISSFSPAGLFGAFCIMHIGNFWKRESGSSIS